MADLSKIVCLEQDCRHGTEQTGSSGSGNDTYTKAEIDSKDADIRAAASEAKSAANNAQSVNQTQDGQIKALQEAVDNLHNYEHPAYSAHQLGFYKFANDAIGSVSDAQPVTKKDITDLGIPESDTNTTYKLSKTGSTITLTGADGSSNSVDDSDTTYELSLPAYANQKDPPVPMLSLSGSDDSRNEQAIPYAYTVLKDIVYEEFSGYKFGGKYRSIADLAYVIPYSKPTEIDPCILTADLYLETKMSNGRFSDSAYCFEHTESGSTIWRMHDNAEAYSGDFAETKDWAVLNDEMELSNPKRLVQIIRIGVSDDVFNKLTGGGCARSRLMYHIGRDGAIARPISYYSDISIDASSQARSHSVYSLTKTDVKNVAFTGDYNDLSNKPTIPDISGKQDKSTAVTHTANTAVGSATKPVYVTADGKAAAISHSINSDVPANAKFTDTVYTHPTTSGNKHIPSGGSSGQILRWSADGTAVWGADNNTTYNDATQSAHGLMSAADKKKLDGIADGANKIIVDSALSDTSTNPVQSKAVKTALDGKAASGHTHAMITNSALLIAGASNAVKWVRLGTIVSGGDARSAIIRVWSGNGYNAGPSQNASFEIQIKDGWQSTQSATKACGVTVYRINCGTVKVKVIPTAHDTYTVWVYLPWTYWNGNYAVYGRYKTWTPQLTNQTDEPDGTAADIAYYDHAFITSTVAKATEATAITETAWTAVPATGAAATVGRSIKYLKSGNTVFVQGAISFNASLNTPVCGTMPSDCLPNQKLVFTGWDIIGAPASFAIILDTDGKLSFLSPGTTAYWFKDHRAYSFNFSYHIN